MDDEPEIAAYYDSGEEQGRLAEPSLLGASPHVLALGTAP